MEVAYAVCLCGHFSNISEWLDWLGSHETPLQKDCLGKGNPLFQDVLILRILEVGRCISGGRNPVWYGPYYLSPSQGFRYIYLISLPAFLHSPSIKSSRTSPKMPWNCHSQFFSEIPKWFPTTIWDVWGFAVKNGDILPISTGYCSRLPDFWESHQGPPLEWIFELAMCARIKGWWKARTDAPYE